MNVETTVAFGAPEEIVVRDDGHGMPHAQVPDLFLTHGESWKRTGRFSPNISRPMHGQLGRGRFLVYGIADRVAWRSVSANGETFSETVVLGNRILNAVLDLTDKEQQVLLDLLERTKLASIVRAAQTVADRSDMLHGLRGLLYADETRTVFREVDQLHPMLVNEPWIFGDEWSLALSEAGLTRVVRTLITQHDNVEFASSCDARVAPAGVRPSFSGRSGCD